MDAPNIDAVVNEQRVLYTQHSPTEVMARQMAIVLGHCATDTGEVVGLGYIGNTKRPPYIPFAVLPAIDDTDITVRLGITPGEEPDGSLKQHKLPDGSVILKYVSPYFYGELIDTTLSVEGIDLVLLRRHDIKNLLMLVAQEYWIMETPQRSLE